MNRKLSVSVTLLLMLFTTAALTFHMPITEAQQATPVTQAPSKTPTPLATATTPAAESSETPPVEPDSPIEPFTQADLNVLTGNVQRPNGAVWFADFLYTVCNGDWTIYELNDESGNTRTYIFGVRNAHTMYAEQVAETEPLALWVPDFELNTFNRVTLNGVERIAEDLQGPWGLAYLDENTFLVTNLLANNIVSVTRDGEVTEVMGGLRSPTGIVADGEYIYVANNGSARRAVEWFAVGSDEEPVLNSLVSGLQSVTGMALGSDGYLYFTYALGTRGVVGRVNPAVCRENGGCTNEQVEIVIYTELAAPLAGLTLSPDMVIYMHTIYRPEIYWIDIDGE